MEIITANTETVHTLSDFEQAVKKIDTIETMPAVGQKLIELTADPDFSMGELHDLVQSDPAIAAKILRVSSSPFYGSRPASNLRAGLIRIGMKDLRKLVLASAMMGGKMTKFQTKLWSYSLRVASISESIGQMVNCKDLEDPFLCGLLHDFGTTLMNQVMGKTYRKALGEPCMSNQCAVEQTAFGFDHCDLGVMVAQQWKLFEALEHVMQHHHDPLLVEEFDLSDGSRIAVFVVALARQISMSDDERDGELVEQLGERLKLSAEDVESCRALGLQRYDDMYAGLVSSG